MEKKSKFLGIILLASLISVSGATFIIIAFFPGILPDNRTSIEIMSYSMQSQEFYGNISLEFEREYPNIDLEFIFMDQEEYKKALPLLFESGQAPDIFIWSTGIQTINELLDKGWIQPLHPSGTVPQEWLTRWPDGYFIPGVNTHNDQVYSFPFADNKISAHGYMFYNKAMLKEFGLDDEDPPWTWNELKEACKIIKNQTGSAGIAIPTDPPWRIISIWSSIASSIMTDTLFDYQKGRFAADDERLITAYNYIKSFYDEELVLVGDDPANPYKYDNPFARQALGTGHAAFFISTYWNVNVLVESGFEDFVASDLGISGIPYPDIGPRGALTTSHDKSVYWVSNQTQHSEEVWTFIDWMTKPDGYYAREFISRGLGFLQYANNSKYVTDPIMRQVIEISKTQCVIRPEPLVLNPRLADSRAFYDAYSIPHPPIVVECLLNNSDYEAAAHEMAETQNNLFLQILEEEQNSGLNVSIEDYIFPDWNFDEDFIYP